jgi:hypothetical protein
VPQTDLSLFSIRCSITRSAAEYVVAALFRKCAKSAVFCYSITFHAPYADTGFSYLYTGTDPPDAPG